ncbi:MAG: YeaH/YhbH family protein [Dokdonella sp.]|nr:MAG: YeaH/YhbH family protein [Dokdonella sp.]
MTVRIVDRRQDSKNRTSVNRSRFIRRFRGQIRKAVADAIAKRGIRDLESGETIGIPGKDISEPTFRHGSGGVRESVHPGNDRFLPGDEIDRPPAGQGKGKGSGKAGNDGDGLDEFVFTLSRDEFLDLFFDELALPNLVKRQLARVDDYKRVRAGFTQTGVPTNINLVRTMRGAAGRRIAVGGPDATRLRKLQAELEVALAEVPPDTATVDRLEREIVALRKRREAIPFIDPFDLRYSNRVRVPQPSTQAVMFCLMDVSGSMDEDRKQMAKRFFMLLYLFLNRNYERIEVVFIRHHTSAEEVDEETFFHARETGGTVVSTALRLMREIIGERYSSANWNIYGAQASDGDNWHDDSSKCSELLATALLPLVQYFAYIEITDGEPQNLWAEYQRLLATHGDVFAMRRIGQASDIYPVFQELFRKRGVAS